MIRRTPDHRYQAHCDGALDCHAVSQPVNTPGHVPGELRRKGWSVAPGVTHFGDAINMGVTICPTCLESMRLATLDTVDTGSNDAPPKVEAVTKSPRETMADLVRKIRETMREQR